MADGFTSTEAMLPLPSVALLRDRRAAPAFPLALLGPIWSARLVTAAAAKNAPVDYVALGLLAGASVLIGNARWGSPWGGWSEPPFLWFMAIGNPSSGKTPGMGAVLHDVLPDLEVVLAAGYPEKLARWETQKAEADAIREAWEKEVRLAVKKEMAAPTMPNGAVVPPRPARPRLITSDTTIEAVADILVATPRGLLLFRDELAAFICGFDRYGSGKGGSDRPSWLESWNAKPKTIDRKSRPDPVFVPRFGVSIIGTVQPDRLEEMVSGADDGLIARFLFAFPEPRPFARPTSHHDAEPWKTDLGRLLRLPMVPMEGGDSRPWFMQFTNEAAEVIAIAGREWSDREASVAGLMLGALGKARGQAVRLAVVLELLRWCAERPNEEAPSMVSEDAALAAVGLLDGYFLPMAQRAFGQGVLTNAERHGRTLLLHIIATGDDLVNERVIRDTPNLTGLSSAEAVQAAVGILKRDDVLLEAKRHERRGRPRTDHLVNPRLWELVSRPKREGLA